jgi:diadenosine tetraphosphatase ApaH/serine/threonine PP2A family protein phosphatase
VRVGLLSDVHANVAALEAVLAQLGAVDAIWVTGDTVGYGPDPSEVLALLDERGAVLVQGNHDRAVATGEGIDFFHDQAADAARMHAAWLSQDERETLAGLPQVRTIDRFTLCHGSLRDPLWEYVMTSAAADETMGRASTPFVCCGHTHLPTLFASDAGRTRASTPAPETVYALEGPCLVNPGSVGQPRDGDARASYAIVDTTAPSITFHRVTYDVRKTQQRIRARGLPEMFAQRLTLGL